MTKIKPIFMAIILIFATAASHASYAAGNTMPPQAGQMDIAMQKIDMACQEPSSPGCATMLNQLEPSNETPDPASNSPAKAPASPDTVAAKAAKSFTRQ